MPQQAFSIVNDKNKLNHRFTLKMSLDIASNVADESLDALEPEVRTRVRNQFFTRTGKTLAETSNGEELYAVNPLPPKTVLCQRKAMKFFLESPSYSVEGHQLQFWDAREFEPFYSELKKRLQLHQGRYHILFVRMKRISKGPENHLKPMLPAFLQPDTTYRFVEIVRNEDDKDEEVPYEAFVSDTSASLPIDNEHARQTHYVVLKRLKQI